MNYRCTPLAPVKRNIYAAPRHVPLSKHYRRMTYGLAHAKSTMLPRQTYFSVALHSFRHQRFIVGERNGKRADYFYPRIDVSPTLVYLLGRREREIEKRLGFRLFGWSHKNVYMILSKFHRRKVEDCKSNFYKG